MTLFLMLCVGRAEAFVGAFVAPEGVVVDHHHAAAVVFRSDSNSGVLTLTSEVSGGASRFAWVVPVVGGTDPAPTTVSSVDYAALDAWTAPQLVRVTCEDLFPFFDRGDRPETGEDRPTTGPRSRGKGPWGCGGGGGGRGDPPYYNYGYYGYYDRGDTASPYGGDVQPVLASVSGPEFVATDWTFTVVEGTALLAALDAAGFAASTDLQTGFDADIAAGRRFVIAEANLGTPADGRWLEPFQLAFESALSPLLIRSGRSASSGEQDLVIHTLTDGSMKGVEVNYEDLSPETSCLVDSLAAFDGFYDAEMAEAFAQLPDEAGGAGWTREYEAPNGMEESGNMLDTDVLGRFGRTGNPSEFVLTRSRVRYDPAVLAKDPALSTNPDFTFGHVRYVLHDESLESDFATCNVPFPVDPGSCFDEATEEPDTGRGTMAGVGVILAAGALWRALRRRR